MRRIKVIDDLGYHSSTLKYGIEIYYDIGNKRQQYLIQNPEWTHNQKPRIQFNPNVEPDRTNDWTVEVHKINIDKQIKTFEEQIKGMDQYELHNYKDTWNMKN